MKKIYLENLPIIKVTEKREKPFIELVNQILTIKQSDPNADTSQLEREIDLLVYELYGLTEEEIK
jgi:adenine-specific DNA-methyltransferase